MKTIKLALHFTMAFAGLFVTLASAKDLRPRVLVLSDISRPDQEPDDQQSLVRLLVYSNEIDIEGLIATTSTWRRDELNPETIQLTIDAYEKVRNNLLRRASGFPAADELRAKVFRGQPGYGMSAVGHDKSSEGSRHVVSVVLDVDDERPVWVLVWGGGNSLAQALWDVRNERPRDVPRFVAKLRVYDIGGQDDAGAWSTHEFPDLFWIRSRFQWRAITHRLDAGARSISGAKWNDSRGGNETFSAPPWFDQNVQQNHGPLGAIYPDARYLHEGDTPSLLHVIPNGLSDPEHIDWGGWGGRFSTTKSPNIPHASTSMGKEELQWRDYGMFGEAADTWTGHEVIVHRTTGKIESDKTVTYKDSIYAPLFRWRETFQNDFAARMDWAAGHADANHNPIAVLNGDTSKQVIHMSAKSGQTIALDASASSDPDDDELSFHWFHYREPGTFPDMLKIQNSDTAVASFVAPNATEPHTMHVILVVKDDGSPNLSAYRRVIVAVGP